MANTRFMLGNLAEGAAVVNGAAGGPSRNEYSPYTMERALNRDRRSVCKFNGGGGGVVWDLDFGSATTLGAVAALGWRNLDGGSWSSLNVYRSSTYYPAAVTWAGVFFSSFGGDPGRDQAGTWTPASARYWRVEFGMTASPKLYTLGRIVLLNTVLDLGLVYGQGGVVAPFQNRLEQGMQDGSFNLNTLGDPGADISLPFPSVNDAFVGTYLKPVAAAAGSVVYIDDKGAVRECIVTGGRVAPSRRFNDLYDASLEMRRLP